MNLGVYMHIPFCLKKCLYCDFPSQAGGRALYPAYATALCKEISARGGLLPKGARVDTVYIGGGTPTALPSDLLENIIQALQDSFNVTDEAEFTIEANPKTAIQEMLIRLRRAGVNRISFGAQSFADDLLRKLGRMHSADQIREAVSGAREAGFGNISLDLMYGLPGETLQNVKDDVQSAVSLGVEHISAYGLIVEAGTPLAAMRESGALMLPDEASEEAMYDHIADALPQNGYRRYEISSYAKDSFESRHNMKYWQDAPYIGLGAAAHSYLGAERSYNAVGAKDYIDRVNAGLSPIERTVTLSETEMMEEFCFLSLRTREGISIARFNEKFNSEFFSVYGHIIDSLKKKNLIVCDEKFIALTQLGMKYGNQAFMEFLLK